MKIKGYEIGDKPTHEEFAAYFKVKNFLRNEWIACWLEGEEPLTQDEFDDLCLDYEGADFSAEECDYLGFLYDEIVSYRGAEER